MLAERAAEAGSIEGPKELQMLDFRIDDVFVAFGNILGIDVFRVDERRAREMYPESTSRTVGRTW